MENTCYAGLVCNLNDMIKIFQLYHITWSNKYSNCKAITNQSNKKELKNIYQKEQKKKLNEQRKIRKKKGNR